jgi:NADPH-dependent curcumin reductase CurA
MSNWVKERRIKWKETILEGIDNAFEAFLDLFKVTNFDKMLVQIIPN